MTDLAYSAAQIRGSVYGAARGPFKPGGRVDDALIREAVHAAVLRDFSISRAAPQELQDARPIKPCLVHEFALARGHVVADLAVIDPAAVHLFEFKSDCDSLERLDEQQRVYSESAEFVTLVVGWKLAALALARVPAWWEVWLCEREIDSHLRFIPLRPLVRNPAPTRLAQLELLQRPALSSAMRAIGLVPNGSNAELRATLRVEASAGVVRAALAQHQRHRLTGTANGCRSGVLPVSNDLFLQVP
jgi:hypothetical protein